MKREEKRRVLARVLLSAPPGDTNANCCRSSCCIWRYARAVLTSTNKRGAPKIVVVSSTPISSFRDARATLVQCDATPRGFCPMDYSHVAPKASGQNFTSKCENDLHGGNVCEMYIIQSTTELNLSNIQVEAPLQIGCT